MRPALLLEDLLSNPDLFLLAVLIRSARTAEAVPGLLGELQSAVVSVAGVDVPVSAGFAFGDLVPDALLRCLGGCPALIPVSPAAATAPAPTSRATLRRLVL